MALLPLPIQKYIVPGVFQMVSEFLYLGVIPTYVLTQFPVEEAAQIFLDGHVYPYFTSCKVVPMNTKRSSSIVKS